MFLHLGGDVVVAQKDIVAIFDLDTASLQKNTKNFLTEYQKNNMVTVVSSELPKSFVLVNSFGKNMVYISALNSKTLEGRIKKPSNVF